MGIFNGGPTHIITEAVQIVRGLPGTGFKLAKNNNYDMKNKTFIILTLRMISKLVMLMTPWLKI